MVFYKVIKVLFQWACDVPYIVDTLSGSVSQLICTVRVCVVPQIPVLRYVGRRSVVRLKPLSVRGPWCVK